MLFNESLFNGCSLVIPTEGLLSHPFGLEIPLGNGQPPPLSIKHPLVSDSVEMTKLGDWSS